MYPVELYGHAVRLREFREDDTVASLRIVGDTRVTQWLSYDNRSPEEAAAMIQGAIKRARIEPRNEYYLAVTLNDEFIGFSRLGFSGVNAAKLGYAIRADLWGHGYAKDAARTLTEFGFKELGLHRISAAMSPDNIASISVATSLGMQFEGHIRDHVFTNGRWRDSVLYAVLEPEWRARLS